MSCVMTRAEAARLYTTLDETIGVFREEDMSEKAIEFYETKKEEFIDLFSIEIPEDYWFQGTVALSASLIFDSLEGFHVVCSTGEAGAQKLIEEVVNPALSNAGFEVAASSDLEMLGTV